MANICEELRLLLEVDPRNITTELGEWHLRKCPICSTHGEGSNSKQGEWNPPALSGTTKPEMVSERSK